MSEGLGSVKLFLVDSLEEAMNFKRWLSERRPHDAISIDIETGEYPGNDPKDALNPWKGRIRTVQVGDGQTGWTMAWDEWAGLFYECLIPFTGKIIFHNIDFEARWFALQSRWKLPWHQSHDTMLMSQIIQPNRQSHALKTLTSQLVDRNAAGLQKMLDQGVTQNGWTWGTVPVNYPPYWQYGALDTVITTRLALDHLYPKVAPGSDFERVYELEMNTRRITTLMEINGARVDLDYCKREYDKLLQYSEKMKVWGKDNFGASLTSNMQMVKKFEEFGEEFTEFTGSGSPSVNKEQLAKFALYGSPKSKALADAIINIRKAEKLASSYFLNFMNDHSDGILHPSINIMAARTGRMSITQPALQTLPSNDPLVRRAFIPRNDGELIVASDLDQVEFRLTAIFSQDPQLLELFHDADRTGGDVFTSIMRQIYQDDTLQKSDKRRKLVKGTVYGKLYGAGVEKMALTSKVPENDMRAVVDAFDESYPGIKTFQKATERMGDQRLKAEGEAYVKTRLGRRLPADEDRLYSLTNYMIQSTAAEVFKKNLVKLDAAGLTDYMVVPVHDEIVLSIPEEEVQNALPTIRECMTSGSEDGWSLTLTADVEGPFPNWGTKYEKKD